MAKKFKSGGKLVNVKTLPANVRDHVLRKQSTTSKVSPSSRDPILPAGNAKHKSELPIALRPYAFHGLEFRETKTEGITSCIFCGKPGHFYVNNDTGQYHCKVCSEKGNQYTWLAERMRLALEQTTDDDWKAIAKERGGFDWKAYRDKGIACEVNSAGNREWLIPVKNLQGTFANICVWGGKGTSFIGTDNCAMHLFGGEQLKNAPKDAIIVIAEGFHDTVPLEMIVSLVKSDKKVPADHRYRKIIVVGVPGAGTFKDEWAEALAGRPVVLVYDNDNAGAKGMEVASAKLLEHKVGSLSRILWSPDANEGHDLSDFIHERLFPRILNNKETDPLSPLAILDDLFGLCVPVTTADPDSSPEKPPRPRIFVDKKTGQPYRPSWDQVIREYRKVFNTHKETEEALAIMFAVPISNQIKSKNPLWLHIVGPPGCGKTEALMTLTECPNVIFRSTMTAQSLISGYKAYTEGVDFSDIPKFVGNTVVLKDYTEILMMNEQAAKELSSVQRGAYDGSASRSFGNGETRVYDRTTLGGRDCHYSFLTGVTHKIHSHDDAIVGERFVKVTFISPQHHDSRAHVLASLMQSTHEFRERTDRLKQVAFEFLDFEIDPTHLPEPSAEMNNRLSALAEVISHLRAGVDRERSGELSCRPQAEIGTRIAQQLKKLMQSLCYVFDKKKIDDDIYRYAERLAFDTAYGWNLDVVACMVKHYPRARTVNELALECQIGPSNLRNRLNNMMELGMVSMKRPVKEGRGAGQPQLAYAISDAFMHFWKEAKIKFHFTGPVNALQQAYERARKGKEPKRLKTLDRAAADVAKSAKPKRSAKLFPQKKPQPQSKAKVKLKSLPKKGAR